MYVHISPKLITVIVVGSIREYTQGAGSMIKLTKRRLLGLIGAITVLLGNLTQAADAINALILHKQRAGTQHTECRTQGTHHRQMPRATDNVARANTITNRVMQGETWGQQHQHGDAERKVKETSCERAQAPQCRKA